MSKVRVLVGTRKGAFILTSDGKRENWDVSGPHFAGWEIYHLKGSPVDPNRIYASQTSGWFGQVIQRSDDGGADLEPRRQQVRLRRRPRHPPVVRRHAPPVGVQTRLASRALAHRSRHRLRRRRRRRPLPLHRRRPELERTLRPPQARLRPPLAARRRRHVPAHHHPRPERPEAHLHRHLRRRRLPHRRRRQNLEAHQPGPPLRSTSPTPPPRSATASTTSPCTPRGPARSSCRSTGTSCAPTTPATHWTEVSGNLPTDFGFVIDVHAHEPETIYVVPIKSDSEHFPPDGKLRVYRSRTGGNEWEPLTKGLPQENCYVNVLRDAMSVDSLDDCGVYFGTTGGQVYASPTPATPGPRSSAIFPPSSPSRCRRLA